MENATEKVVDSLAWFCGRYLELCLFRYLQHVANGASEICEDRKTYIFCILFVLLGTNARERRNFTFQTVGRSKGDDGVLFQSANAFLAGRRPSCRRRLPGSKETCSQCPLGLCIHRYQQTTSLVELLANPTTRIEIVLKCGPAELFSERPGIVR